MRINSSLFTDQKPVLLIMDYAFGLRAFELMDELLQPCERDGVTRTLNVQSRYPPGRKRGHNAC